MKTKKILCTLMAVMCMGTAALTGCGSGSDSSTASSANSAAAAQTNESVDVTAVADTFTRRSVGFLIWELLPKSRETRLKYF